jgi:hypothetical protein
MAKPAKAAEKETKPAKAEAADKPKFGVPELADALGIEPTSVRVKLRNAGIDKEGRSYGWNTQKDFDAVVKQLKSTPDKPAKEDKAEAKPADKKKAPPKKK